MRLLKTILKADLPVMETADDDIKKNEIELIE